MNKKLLENIIKLRRKGHTFPEIKKILKINNSKASFSQHCKGIILPECYYNKIKNIRIKNLQKIMIIQEETKNQNLKKIMVNNKNIIKLIKNKDVSRLSVAMLYLGEGAKTKSGYLSFGNADPFIINLFLDLFRYSFVLDEKKFRCTVQCRADQNVKKLEKFWSKLTKIPLAQFYKTRIDPRTIGKPTKKTEYKGVCKIDYFSSYIYKELKEIPKLI